MLRELRKLGIAPICFTFAEGDAPPAGSEGEKIDKTEHERIVGELNTKIKELRDEVVSQDYLDFLESKGKPPAAPAKAPEPKPGEKTDTSELAKQVQDLASTIDKADKDRINREIQQFADTHEDFEEVKPIMIGISSDPKFKDASLHKLYTEAKKYIQSKEDAGKKKAEDALKQKSATGEKPTGGAGAFDQNKKYTPDEAAREALKEIEEAGGVF